MKLNKAERDIVGAALLVRVQALSNARRALNLAIASSGKRQRAIDKDISELIAADHALLTRLADYEQDNPNED